MKKVSKIKNILKSCLALIRDKYAIAELTALIEETQKTYDLKKGLIISGKN